MSEILLIAYVALLLAAAVVTLLKGKWGMLLAGLVFGFAWVVAALRLAKPGSLWWRRLYDRDKQQRAREVAPDGRRGTESRLPQRIPDGQYIVLGDNRVQSCDSRVWGPLPRDRLIARAAFRYWPVDRIGVP